MRQSCRVLRALSATGMLRLKVPTTREEERRHFEQMEKEAQERGFGRRTSGDDKVFMDKKFQAPEKVDGVAVANLPAKAKEETAFTKYERSSTEFTSIVQPHGKEASPLGAGFGVRPDKRLGFLRPRQTLQPYSGGSTSITPKYDENGMPVDDTLSHDERMKKRMDYLRSIEGTTMSHNEHFLLADLDFEKDAILFGNTREEFEKNVTKLKNVILTYNKWERTDNFYYYTTILMKVMVVWVLIECVQQYYDLCLFRKNYDTFAEVMEKEIAALADKRDTDLAQVRDQLQFAKPDFSPVVAAIRAERDRVAAEETVHAATAAKAREQQQHSDKAAADAIATVTQLTSSMQQQQQQQQQQQEQEPGPAQAREEACATSAAVATTRTKTVVTAAPRSLLQAPTHHPMDTMGGAAYTRRQQREEEAREMKRLHEAAARPEQYSFLHAVWRRVRGKESGTLSRPMQQEDFARFSYAASPTSIEALRLVRRTLLPRSEDYAQVVREEMLAYKREKERRTVQVAASP